MNKQFLKNIVSEAYIEVLEEKAKKKTSIKKTTLDQSKDGNVGVEDAVIAARKRKIAASKGQTKKSNLFATIQKIINNKVKKSN